MPSHDHTHCVKSVRIRSDSGPHFPAFGLNTERYCISPYSVRMREMRTRITPKTDTFYAVTFKGFCEFLGGYDIGQTGTFAYNAARVISDSFKTFM